MLTSWLRSGGVRAVAFALSMAATTVSSAAASDVSPVLQRVRDTGKLVLGYQADARPFSYTDEAGKAAGFVVALCERIAEEVRAELKLVAMPIEWRPVTTEAAGGELQDGRVALLCGPAVVTLAGRKEVSFSVPVFPSGIGALMRADSRAGVRDVLSGRTPNRPYWRGSPAIVLESQTFAVVSGSVGERWLGGRIDDFRLASKVLPVRRYEDGVERVLDRGADVLFGDRAVLLDAARRHPSARELIVLERSFTLAPIAIAMARGDDSLRLVVDRTLSRQFGTKAFVDLYVKWFGEPGEAALDFYRQTAIPE